MQNIVRRYGGRCKRLNCFIKNRSAGSGDLFAAFCYSGKLLQEDGLSECPGFVGMANTLCTCETRYREIQGDSLLGKVAVAEDLDSAVAIARRFRYRFRRNVGWAGCQCGRLYDGRLYAKKTPAFEPYGGDRAD